MKTETEALFDAPCWIIDILPKQVPEGSGGQYFALEKYFLSEPARTEIRERHIRLILKLNCYRDVTLEPDPEPNPPPERIVSAMRNGRALLRFGDSLIVSEPDDINMTLFGPDPEFLDLVKAAAPGEGLFVWQP